MREGAGSMKRKQKEGAPKTKQEEGLWIEGGLCNSFIELIASETSAIWPEAAMPQSAFCGL